MINKRPDNFIYFFNGSIGDMLMSIYLLENVYKNYGKETAIIAVIPRNKKIYTDLISKYQYIKIIETNLKSIDGIISIFKMLALVFSINYILTAPTPGFIPKRTMLMAKFISITKKSLLIGYSNKNRKDLNIYDKVINLDTGLLYYKNLSNSLKEFDMENKIAKPNFKCVQDDKIQSRLNLSKNGYIVMHPFGSNKDRSILDEELLWTIEEIKKRFKGTIVITGSRMDKEKLSLAKYISKVVIAIEPSMHELCSLFNNSKLFIGVDTGPTHLASVLGKRTLIISHNGTEHWQTYYNENATILYKVKNCNHGLPLGREHMEKCRNGKLYSLERVPQNMIIEGLKEIFK